MADVTDSGSTEEPKRSRRRLKQPTETVRERVQRIEAKNEPKQETTTKNGETRLKTGLTASFWSGFTWPLRKLGALLAPLGRFKVIRGIGLVLFPRYFRNSWRELRMVTWPDRKTSWKLTYAVIVFSILFGVIVFIVDFILDKIFKEILIK